MPKSRIEQNRVEAYARILHEAARDAGRIDRNLEHLEVLNKLSPEMMDTLTVLFEQGEQGNIGDVLSAYKTLVETDETTIPVTITTAVPLDDELRAKISAQCEQDFGVPVFLVEKVDPSILGGIVVEARNQRRDASVRTQLANIRSNLSSAFAGGDE